jgi:hypothetical protein
MRCFAMFSVAKVVKTFGPEPGIAESLDDFRYKILKGGGWQPAAVGYVGTARTTNDLFPALDGPLNQNETIRSSLIPPSAHKS